MLSWDANTVVQLSVWPPKPPWAQCLGAGAPHSVPQCGSPSAALCSVLRENVSWAICEVRSTPEVHVLFPLCHFPPSGHNVSSRMLSHYRDCAAVSRNATCCLPWVHWVLQHPHPNTGSMRVGSPPGDASNHFNSDSHGAANREASVSRFRQQQR